MGHIAAGPLACRGMNAVRHGVLWNGVPTSLKLVRRFENTRTSLAPGLSGELLAVYGATPSDSNTPKRRQYHHTSIRCRAFTGSQRGHDHPSCPGLRFGCSNLPCHLLDRYLGEMFCVTGNQTWQQYWCHKSNIWDIYSSGTSSACVKSQQLLDGCDRQLEEGSFAVLTPKYASYSMYLLDEIGWRTK